jgi:hypothetical protein
MEVPLRWFTRACPTGRRQVEFNTVARCLVWPNFMTEAGGGRPIGRRRPTQRTSRGVEVQNLQVFARFPGEKIKRNFNFSPLERQLLFEQHSRRLPARPVARPVGPSGARVGLVAEQRPRPQSLPTHGDRVVCRSAWSKPLVEPQKLSRVPNVSTFPGSARGLPADTSSTARRRAGRW